MSDPTPEALAGQVVVEWEAQLTIPVSTMACLDLRQRIALALTEQARAHEKCIEGIQADQLAMANRENELHDEKDKRLAEQARENAKDTLSELSAVECDDERVAYVTVQVSRAWREELRAAAQGGTG
jgi:hypothetical protein